MNGKERMPLIVFIFCVLSLLAFTGKALASERNVSGVQEGCAAELPLMISAEERDEVISTVRDLLINDYVIYLQGGRTVISDALERENVSKITPFTPAMEAKLRKQEKSIIPLRVLRVDFEEVAALAEIEARNISDEEYEQMATRYRAYFGCSLKNLEGSLEEDRLRMELVYRAMESMASFSRIGYFDVLFRSCKVVDALDTGNQFIDPAAWDGSRFLVLDVSFKNIDAESRVPFSGSVFISIGGMMYEFDEPEQIMHRGYGVPLKGINPLVTYRTKLVYRVPEDSFKEVFWEPGRNSQGQRLYCGL